MPRGGRKCVVVIVPAFPLYQQATAEGVPRVVAALVIATTAHVAQRVDGKSNVLYEENPYQSSPQESQQRTSPAHREQSTQRRRQQQTENHPYVIGSVYADQ